MKEKGKSVKLIPILIFALIIAAGIAGAYLSAEHSLTGENPIFYNIKTTITEPGGRQAEVYCSGDQYFNYMHDSAGNILILNDYGYLMYAKSDKTGRPVPSGLSATREATAMDLLLYGNPKMKYSDINFENNPDLLTSFPTEDEKNVLEIPKAAGAEAVEVNNYIIYICFEGDNENAAKSACAGISDFCNAYENSLRAYYLDVTSGYLTVNSLAPANGGQVAVYKDSHSRKYYTPWSYSNPNGYRGDAQRGAREAMLLTSAVGYASSYFGAGNPDTDGDGMVDSVTFVIYGSYSSTSWNTLLWPHSWALDDINRYYNNNASAKIKGVEVGDYTVQFSAALTTGVLCHEFGHVLGAPDLYHYNQKDYVPVGEWDLMSMDQDTPQYMTAYLRDKYLGYVGESQIASVSASGVYSLAPVTLTDAFSSGVYAYKIPGRNSTEYFMAEYRTAEGEGVFEDELPGNGLIIYRVNTSVNSGNRDAAYKNINAPDEIFVFRPNLPSSLYQGYTDSYNKSLIEAWYSALSPQNEYFKSVGAPSTASVNNYSNSAVYYTDGTNSGITVTVLSASPEKIDFYVSLPSVYGDYQGIPSKLYIDGVSHFGGETSVSLVTAPGLDFSLLTSVKLKLYDNALNVIKETEIRNKLIENFYKGQSSSFNFELSDAPRKAKIVITTATGVILEREFTDISEDIISGISVSGYKTEYGYGSALDKSVGSVSLITNTGKMRTVPLSYASLSFSAFDGTAFEPQSITVSYHEFTASMNVRVVDRPASLLISGTKCYLAGDPLALNASVLWEGGAKGSISFSSCSVKYMGADFVTAGKAVGSYPLTVTATVAGSEGNVSLSADFTVKICNQATSLDLYKGGAKIAEGSTTVFDSAPLALTIIANEGEADEEDVTGSAEISYNPFLVNANQTLTVKYLGLTRTRTIKINDYITRIEFDGNLNVKFNENLSGKLKLYRAGGTVSDKNLSEEGITVTGFDKTSLGAQTVTLAYGGKNTVIAVNVIDYITSAQIPSFATEYLIGDSLKESYTLNYATASGASGTVSLSSENFSGFSAAGAGSKIVEVVYSAAGCGECVYYIAVTVLDPAVRLEPSGNIRIYDVVYGNDFTLNIYAVFKSGATKLLNYTEYTVTGFDKNTKGEQLVTVSYEWNAAYPEVTLEVEVCVHDAVTKLILDTAANNVKVNYPYGEALDLRGVILKAVTGSGQSIPLIDGEGNLRENVTVSAFDPTYVGGQRVTIGYEGFSVYYNVTVRAKTANFISGGGVEIDKSKRYIFVKIATTFETLKEKVTFESAEMTLVGESGRLKTGSTATVENRANQAVDTFTVIVIGDLTGDGMITENDLEILAKYITGQTKTNAAVIAADMDGNGAVGINDYMLMRKYMLEAEE